MNLQLRAPLFHIWAENPDIYFSFAAAGPDLGLLEHRGAPRWSRSHGGREGREGPNDALSGVRLGASYSYRTTGARRGRWAGESRSTEQHVADQWGGDNGNWSNKTRYTEQSQRAHEVLGLGDRRGRDIWTNLKHKWASQNIMSAMHL